MVRKDLDFLGLSDIISIVRVSLVLKPSRVVYINGTLKEEEKVKNQVKIIKFLS